MKSGKLQLVKCACIALLCCALFSLPLFSFAAHQAPSGNYTRYIPKDKDGKNQEPHTIYWTEGIIPPEMPGQIEGKSKGSFKLIDTILDKEIDSLQQLKQPDGKYHPYTYVTEYVVGANWYDAKKFTPYDIGTNPGNENKFDGASDANLCWAASASNNLQWWLQQNRHMVEEYAKLGLKNEGFADISLVTELYPDSSTIQFSEDGLKIENNPVWRLMRKLAPKDKGGYSNKAFDAFFNGYQINFSSGGRNSPNSLIKESRAGFFHPVFGANLLSSALLEGKSYNYLSSNLKEWLQQGYAVTVSHKVMQSQHAVTLWGAEYDENDKLCGLFVTDNNDGKVQFTDKNKQRHTYSMKYYSAFESNQKLAITQNVIKKGNNTIGTVMLLYPATEELEQFLKDPNHSQLSPANGQEHFFPDYMLESKPHTCKYVYSIEGSSLVRSCEYPRCDENSSIRFEIEGGDYVYNQKQHRPAVKPVLSNSDLAKGLKLEYIYGENLNAGGGTITAKIKISNPLNKIEPTVLELPLSFTIRKAEAPLIVPELESKTHNSITLKAVEGIWYSINDNEWTRSNFFDSLSPLTEYSFKAKMDETNNYLASDERKAKAVVFATSQMPEPQVSEVEGLISDIGDVSLASEEKIKKARNAFNKLSSQQQQYVSNIKVLEEAEKELERLKNESGEPDSDKLAADSVIEKIDSIKTVTLESASLIATARDAYEALSENAKKLVGDSIKVLEEAEKELERLKNESGEPDRDKLAADSVIEKIDSIKTVTLESASLIATARDAYEALSENAKKLVGDSIKVLEEAEKELERLKNESGEPDSDKLAADSVIEKIEAIGDVSLSLECRQAIRNARLAYNSLSSAAKKLVGSKVKILKAAEEELRRLESLEEDNNEDEVEHQQQEEKERPFFESTEKKIEKVDGSLLDRIIEKAIKNKQGTVYISFDNADEISLDVFKSIAQKAGEKNISSKIMADTVSENAVVGRIIFDAEKAAAYGNSLMLKVSIDHKATRELFNRFFINEMIIVNLRQPISFGQRVEIAVKVDTSRLDSSRSWSFYSYDSEKNEYRDILNSDYSIDANGYLHFYTETAGKIIITDRPMTSK